MTRLDERLSRMGDFYIAYHRTPRANVDLIINEGFRPGYGAFYGKGWYFTYDLDSQLRPQMVTYGDALMKCKISPKNLLIFDYNISNDLWGNEYTLMDQLLIHYKLFHHEKVVPTELFHMSKDLEQTFQNPTYSADRANHVWTKHFIKGGMPTIPKVYGIVLTGNQDGNVLVSYNYDTAIPFEFAIPDPLTQQLLPEGFQSVQTYKAENRATRADIANEIFNGKVKRFIFDKYPVDDIKVNFKWLMNADYDSATIEITDDGKLIWHDGTWKRGTWEGDEWLAGNWKSGKWKQGIFKGGTWTFGNFMGGEFDGGDWADGTWTGGTWTSGYWRTGTIMKGKRPVESQLDPSRFLFD